MREAESRKQKAESRKQKVKVNQLPSTISFTTGQLNGLGSSDVFLPSEVLHSDPFDGCGFIDFLSGTHP